MGLLTGIRSRKRARKVHGGENFRTLPQRDSFNTTTTHATITASGYFTTPTLTIEPGSTGMVITNDEMARQGQRVTGMHIPCKVHSLQRYSRRLNERKLFRRTPLSSSFLLFPPLFIPWSPLRTIPGLPSNRKELSSMLAGIVKPRVPY